MIESCEWVCYCDECGVEFNDDNKDDDCESWEIDEEGNMADTKFLEYNCPECGEKMHATRPLTDDTETTHCFCIKCQADLAVTVEGSSGKVTAKSVQRKDADQPVEAEITEDEPK